MAWGKLARQVKPSLDHGGVSHEISGSGFEWLESVHRLLGFVVCVQSYKKDSPSYPWRRKAGSTTYPFSQFFALATSSPILSGSGVSVQLASLRL